MLCRSRKYLYYPPQKGLEIPGQEGGVSETQNLKQCMKLNWNFQGVGGVLGKMPFILGILIFSGTTHLLERNYEYL